MVNRRASGRSSQRVGRAATEDAGHEAVIDATRQLLGITTPAEAADVARNLIAVLGGQIVPAAGAPSSEAYLEAVLGGLTQNVTSLLGLSGSGVTMAGDGRLHLVAVGFDASGELVGDHELQHPCLCRDACATDEVVKVTDVRLESTLWPEFSATATRLAVAGVAAIPLRLADQSIGSLNLYSTEPRAWSDEDIALAELLADVATCHLVNESRQRRQGQFTEQVQEALESRIVIEQAKEIFSDQHGITLERAYQRMRRHARSKHTSLRLVSEAIVAVGLRI